VSVAVAVLVVAVTVGTPNVANPRKDPLVVSVNSTVPLGLVAGTPVTLVQATVAVSTSVPPAATVGEAAVTVVVVGNTARGDGWAVAGDANAAIPVSATAPTATWRISILKEYFTTALLVAYRETALSEIPCRQIPTSMTMRTQADADRDAPSADKIHPPEGEL
jgi:hypothetical protein